MSQESPERVITAIELKRLLVLMAGSCSEIFFRCRVAGEMWMKNHCRVIRVTDDHVILYDAPSHHYYSIRINKIMQFDLDDRLHHYQPHFHYQVEPSIEVDEVTL